MQASNRRRKWTLVRRAFKTKEKTDQLKWWIFSDKKKKIVLRSDLDRKLARKWIRKSNAPLQKPIFEHELEKQTIARVERIGEGEIFTYLTTKVKLAGVWSAVVGRKRFINKHTYRVFSKWHWKIWNFWLAFGWVIFWRKAWNMINEYRACNFMHFYSQVYLKVAVSREGPTWSIAQLFSSVIL